ncbi:hypothetical protein M408DRAFT_331258 [Serendipita vermifera MAFF 305830]|uniref:Aminotransferase class V domain-containing protein n=1 Tax=Serendipita vermifera MAFF 305830 TaxID=933852 RepID=A0A0C3AZD7_SERVB|nr:hypothetical protein M408DRAFT_331258 [Serendipita vermifera MAFF 305830]
MLAKISSRFNKGGQKDQSDHATTALSSPNLSSAEMEALALSPPSSIWRPRSPKPSSRPTTPSKLVSKFAYNGSKDPKLSLAYPAFINRFPSYAKTQQLDNLREREFRRLQESRVVYMDYMGACLYPDFLVKEHLQLLTQQVVGNTHSDSPSSTLSEKHVSAARQAVLSFFNASPEEYVCIFTSNCTSALKIVGESFPFEPASRFVLAEDSHNSVNGIRKFAEQKGSNVEYIPSRLGGGFDESKMLDALRDGTDAPSLLALTGQSNISGFRPNLPVILSAAKKQGYYTLLDGAALSSTSKISLNGASSSTDHLNGQVDALAISFYKLFGYPTGVGALVARKDFLRKLKKPWFSGGTVEVVMFPSGLTESKVPWERFEEGTLNYASLAAIPAGLRMTQELISGPKAVLPLRLGILHRWLHEALEGIKHSNGAPVVKVLTPNRESVDANKSQLSLGMGYILSLTFHDPTGTRMRNAEVSRQAAALGISLRTGCGCNPGAAVGLLGLRDDMARMQESTQGMSERIIEYADIEGMYGQEVGVVRLSLGLVSNFRDVWEVERFVRGLAQ